ncbi:hypothetical protein U1Q18_051196 [Sarracenia purpurea var. burkii]
MSYRSVRILKLVISKGTPEQRSRQWKENWLKFCMFTKSSDMNDLFELCLEDATERNDFRHEVMMRSEDDKIQEYCFYLLNVMQLVKLDEFLKVRSTDVKSFMRLKQCLARSYFLSPTRGVVVMSISITSKSFRPSLMPVLQIMSSAEVLEKKS